MTNRHRPADRRRRLSGFQRLAQRMHQPVRPAEDGGGENEVEHFKLRVNIRIDLANRVIADVNQ